MGTNYYLRIPELISSRSEREEIEVKSLLRIQEILGSKSEHRIKLSEIRDALDAAENKLQDHRPRLQFHIGKSSGGWCFGLHVDQTIEIEDRLIRIRSLDDWQHVMNLPGIRINNEYGDQISSSEMVDIITKRQGLPVPVSKDFLAQNSASLGPNNLLRHRLDGRHCVGHGNGTYDLIVGDFS